MFHRKDSSGRQKPRQRPGVFERGQRVAGESQCLRRAAATDYKHAIRFLYFCLFAASVQAGTFIDSLFTSGADTIHCVASDGVFLDIHYRDAMRMEYGPVRPLNSATPKTPDVAIMKNNHLRFFWSDSQSAASGPRLYRMDALVSDTGITLQDTVAVSGNQILLQRPLYLHADAFDTLFFVSVVEKNLFRGYANKPTVRLDNIGGGTISIFDGSQCHYKDNVFLAVYEQSSAKIACRKVSINAGVPSQSAQEYIIADNQSYCFNPSIAADSAGNVLSLWMQGTKAGSKRLTWAYYDSTFTFHDSATFPGNIDDVNMLNNYDDAPVVSYAGGKFASVNWDPSGIVLRLFEIMPALPLDTMATSSLRVTDRKSVV